MAKKKPSAKSTSVPVDAHKHVADKRPNIPTRETAEFAADEPAPRFVAERDRSLDPQLVWKGKDKQDSHPLDVPAAPIHVQEKIHPQAIVEDLRARTRPEATTADLFSDFNGLDDFMKKLEFYRHEQHWTNRMILGDSLLVMASLAERERLRGQVQCIYFDPPYGIKFGSNWQVSTRKRDVKDAKAEDLTRQPEQIKAFRDTWELGINSYLTYLRDRLTVARDLLTESGSIFVQIGDENVHLVRCLLDEVFGAENFLSQISFSKAAGGLQSVDRVGAVLDFVIWYARDIGQVKYRPMYEEKNDAVTSGYTKVELLDESRRAMTSDERKSGGTPGARPYMTVLMTKPGPGSKFEVRYGGRTYDSGNRWWGTTPEGIQRVIYANRVEATENSIRFVTYFSDFPFRALSNLWSGFGGAADPVYVVQTNSEIAKRCLLMTTDPGDLVLDPTCGSGTTAYVAEQWGRRWITIDTSRVALALARTRLMAGRYPYYLLADSSEGRQKQAELAGQPQEPNLPPPERDLHKGFVYKTVPHVTLKSIANNPDIKEGMTRAQIDAAIARHAETETLYDQPYEDKNVVRVCGPFTVESLSPHRHLPNAEPDLFSHRPGVTDGSPPAAGNFLTTILDNLRKAGVKGTTKGQRIAFARLDPFPGEYIHAEGETDAGAAVRVFVGPEFGTVGDADVKRAALEAIKGSQCELLLLCAFSFEASVHEQTAELAKEIKFGKLRILPVRMNPDLAMGDELLKKTGAGNLFTVFGEPDVKFDRKDGKVTVTIKGVDVFDPTTGAVRTGGIDDIACWFVDTNYDDQSFFVRHAYFLYGGKNSTEGPYDKLKKALRAEIDEAEWSKLYRATSQPFDPPHTGKIAVKVINHFGDEVLKVYRV